MISKDENPDTLSGATDSVGGDSASTLYIIYDKLQVKHQSQ